MQRKIFLLICILLINLNLYSSIYYEIELGNFNKVKKLIENGEDVNTKDKSGNSLLIYAVSYGHEGIVKYLISKGADLNHENIFNETALIHTLRGRRTNISKILIEYGVDVNYISGKIKIPINFAAAFGPLESVKIMVNSGALLNPGKNEKWRTYPVNEACASGHLDIVKYLISKGAGINYKDSKGITALMFASANGYTDIVKYLLDKKAEIYHNDDQGKTALSYAMYYGRKDICELLKTALEKEKLELKIKNMDVKLIQACMQGDVSEIHLLLSQGVDVNTTKYLDKMTPLMIVSLKGYFKIAEYLISKGADINMQDDNGNSPLIHAVKKNNYDVVKLLIDKGAKISFKNKDGDTAWQIAFKHGFIESVKLLVQKREDINKIDEYGNTPLIWASMYHQDPDVIYLLIEKGADVKWQSYSKLNALDYAKKHNKSKKIINLLENVIKNR